MNAMKRIIASLIVTTSVTVFAAGGPEDDLARQGPQGFLHELYANPTRWNAAIDSIETGQSEWVLVALTLYPVADAGARSELHDALFSSLRTQATLVLTNLSTEVTIKDICDGRHDPLATLDLALAEHKAVEVAVSAVGEQVSTTRKSQCLNAARAAELNIRRFFGK